MKKLIDLNKEWFDKTNEMFVSFIKRGGDAYLKDLSHLNLKRDVYLAISNLILYLADGKKLFAFLSKTAGKSSLNPNPKQMDIFKSEIREIFGKFEKGRDYRNISFAESIIDLLGRRMHSSAYQLLADKQVAELEKLMEEFWVNFFALTNTVESQADNLKLEALLSAFENDINKTISS